MNRPKHDEFQATTRTTRTGDETREERSNFLMSSHEERFRRGYSNDSYDYSVTTTDQWRRCVLSPRIDPV